MNNKPFRITYLPSSDISVRAGATPETAVSDNYRLEITGADVSLRTTDAPWQVVYGEVVVGGTIVGIEAIGIRLLAAIVLACHEIDSVTGLYLDGQEIALNYEGGSNLYVATGTNYSGHCEFQVAEGEDDQAALPYFVSLSANYLPGRWTEQHRLQGRAHVGISLIFSSQAFPNGFPNIQFKVRGKNVFDPRSDTTVYSNNPALCIADYLASSRYGAGYIYPDDFNVDSLIEAADICDESIGLNGGGTEARYTCNGAFYTSESKQNILQKLLSSFAGSIAFIGGKWHFFPAKWRTPTLTLDESDLLSGLNVSVKNSMRDTFNAVKGTFLNPDLNWQIADFPPVVNAFYLSQDGDIRSFLDITLPFTTSSATAQRIAKIYLEDTRQPITIECVATLKAFQLHPHDNVLLTIARLGWSAKPFRVLETNLTTQTDESGAPYYAVALRLKETASGIYDWNDGEETTSDLAPNTNLPDPTSVQAPTGLLLESGTDWLYVQGDGTIITRIRLDWTLPDDPFVTSTGNIEIQFKHSTDTDWTDAPSVPGGNNYAFIWNVQDAISYDVRIRSKSGFGFTSEWLTELGHIVLGKTENPSNVTGFTATPIDYGILLTWDAITDVDLSHYEIRLGTSWDSGTFLTEVFGVSYAWQVQAAGTYDFMIRAVDTSNNLSVLFDTAQAVITGPGTPTGTFTISNDTVYLDWEEPSSQFAIASYEISYGDVYATATYAANTTSTFYPVIPNWGGLRRFWIAAIDIAGNYGSPFAIDVNISIPSAVPTLTAQVIDNNVNLYWTPPASHTLTISHYRIYKGDDFGTAEFLGTVAGTFLSRFELLSGTFKYWVLAVDSANNYGTERSLVANVDQPPDYVLLTQVDFDPDNSDTNTNILTLEDGISFIAPVNETETFQDHFINNSWNSPQDQISAGYAYYMQPSEVTGAIRWNHDLGVVLSSATLNVVTNFEELSGDVALNPTISYSEDNSSWTDVVGSWQVLATNFRYVRVKVDIVASNDQGLIIGRQVSLKVDVKLDDDGGFSYAAASDPSGTTVTFTKEFIDVTSITITPAYQSGISITANYDFVDVPNPTEFSVYLFNSTDGSRISGDFSWTAKGYA